jgi:DNA-directed RNA polymerase specialized sigma24 family protein
MRIHAVVSAMTSEHALCEDLNQEAALHLCIKTEQIPDHTRSWYVQSCGYHLKHWMQKGSSVDSLKRRHLQYQPETGDGPETADGFNPVSASDGIQLICALDALDQLWARIDLLDREILLALLSDFSLREIGARLRLSHTAVRKRQRNIAGVARTIGIQG